MIIKIHIDDCLKDDVLEFFRAEGVAAEIVDGECCDIRIVACEDRLESDLETIYSGGRIACETARAVADKLQLPVDQMGRFLYRLNVKICRCALGCFP